MTVTCTKLHYRTEYTLSIQSTGIEYALGSKSTSTEYEFSSLTTDTEMSIIKQAMATLLEYQ